MDLDDTVCYCFHVTKRKLVNFIRISQPRVPSQLSECAAPAPVVAGASATWSSCISRLCREDKPSWSG